jgi:hypothetical protein
MTYSVVGVSGSLVPFAELRTSSTNRVASQDGARRSRVIGCRQSSDAIGRERLAKRLYEGGGSIPPHASFGHCESCNGRHSDCGDA